MHPSMYLILKPLKEEAITTTEECYSVVKLSVIMSCTFVFTSQKNTYPHCTIQSYSRTVVQAHSRQAYNRPVVQLYRRTVVQSYSRTVVQSYRRKRKYAVSAWAQRDVFYILQYF
jgi:hypothetical protein